MSDALAAARAQLAGAETQAVVRGGDCISGEVAQLGVEAGVGEEAEEVAEAGEGRGRGPFLAPDQPREQF